MLACRVGKVRSIVYLVGGLLLIWVLNKALSSHVTLVTGAQEARVG